MIIKYFQKLKYLKAMIYFYKRKIGLKTIDIVRGAGYYLPLAFSNVILGREETWEMQSGIKIIVKLIDYNSYSDPIDMTKESKWQLIGYEKQKLINDCKFSEFLDLYGRYLNLI